MKVLGFLVPAGKGTARDDSRRRRISGGAGHVKTIRASGLPSAMFRPSTDTRDDDDDDEGPFFDLVFPLSLKTELSETSDQSDVEPHDEFFFSGGLLTLDAPETTTTRSRSHFRVLKLGAKKVKPKPESETRNHENAISGTTPLSSLLARDTGLRGCTSARSTSAKLFFEVGSPCQDHEKRSASTLTSTPLAIQKYLSKIKPFYVRVSRGFGERLRFGQAAEPTGMKLVARRLRKSRSASSAVAAVRSPQAAVAPPRRDDSLVEKEDGIEGAIAHCKRSFNKGSMELPLIRSRSDPGEGKRVTI